MGASWIRGPRRRDVMARALGERPRPRIRARAPAVAQMATSALALGAAAPAEARATVRRHTAELAWDEWGGRRRLSLRSSARRDARRERGACLPRDSSWGCAEAGLTCAGRSTARGRLTLARGAPSSRLASSALPLRAQCTVSALEHPISRHRRVATIHLQQ
eukprot:scaffold10291_cov58-Phaeocystis_antarctica.AAC.1